jgi:hypothetical protein
MVGDLIVVSRRQEELTALGSRNSSLTSAAKSVKLAPGIILVLGGVIFKVLCT